MAICDSYCNGCEYQGSFGGGWIYCNYFYIEDKLRPCPAGIGCTVKKVNSKYKEPKINVRYMKKNCDFCGKEFVLRHNMKQRFCCDECRLADRKKQRKEKKNESNG